MLTLIFALLTAAQPSPRGPENTIAIGNNGFEAVFTRADPMTLWKSPHDKEARLKQTLSSSPTTQKGTITVDEIIDRAWPDESEIGSDG